MPPEMAVSMRHTKLKAEEAALLAGEINKPSWESRNEGIHERVSFEDTIWGFDLAGGVFYNTPLRVTFVKPDSRASKAGIRPGDRLKRINDIETSTLTIQEAHDIIVESGIHLKLSVTSPDDEEDAYYCYQDPIVDDGYDSEEERRLEEERARKRRVQARVSHFWSLQWPWVSKRRLVYRESNCFMVPSKYEGARQEKYPPLPTLRYTDEVVHYTEEEQEKMKRIPSLTEMKEKTKKSRQERLADGDAVSDVTGELDDTSYMTDDEQLVNGKTNNHLVEENEQEMLETVSKNDNNTEESSKDSIVVNQSNNSELLSPIPENVEDINQDFIEQNKQENEEESHQEMEVESKQDNDIEIEMDANIEKHTKNDFAEMNGDVNDDDVINEVLGKTNDSAPRGDEDNILDSILSDEGQNLENSEDNER